MSIEVKDLSFSYGEKNILKNISFLQKLQKKDDMINCTTLWSSVCIDQCMSSNNEKEQLWEIGTIEAGSKLNISLDLAPMNTEEAKVFNSEFTFSDGTDEVKFTINYNYTPAQ